MLNGSVVAQQAINGIMLGIMYSLVAVGFSLFFGVLDVINFAHGDVFMASAFVALAVILFLGGNAGTWLGAGLVLLITMVVTGLIGVAAERVSVRPLRASPPLITLLATLGLSSVIREAVRLFYPHGAATHRFPPFLPQGQIVTAGVVIRYDNLIILAVGLLVIVATALLVNRTKLGMGIRAIAQDRQAAMMMGIDVDRTLDATFFLGSVLAAVAGILAGSYYNEIVFTMGLMGGVIGFSAAVIGGLGSVYGAVVGGFGFAFLETFASAALPHGSEYKDVVAFLVVILFLLFRPTGILGEKTSERV